MNFFLGLTEYLFPFLQEPKVVVNTWKDSIQMNLKVSELWLESFGFEDFESGSPLEMPCCLICC